MRPVGHAGLELLRRVVPLREIVTHAEIAGVLTEWCIIRDQAKNDFNEAAGQNGTRRFIVLHERFDSPRQEEGRNEVTEVPYNS